MRWETLKFWYWVRLMLENWRYIDITTKAWHYTHIYIAYLKNYAHGSYFFMVWCWSILPIFFRITSLALGQNWYLHSAGEVIIKDMGKSDFDLQVWGQLWCISFECLGRKLTVLWTWASSNWCLFQVQLVVSNNLAQKQMVFNSLIIHCSTMFNPDDLHQLSKYIY